MQYRLQAKGLSNQAIPPEGGTTNVHCANSEVKTAPFICGMMVDDLNNLSAIFIDPHGGLAGFAFGGSDF